MKNSLRGHPIVCREGEWYYKDTDEPTVSGWKDRPCGRCGRKMTEREHDACLGDLPGVVNACCGHGDREESYICFENGVTVRGFRVEKED